MAQDPIDEFIALPREQQLSTLQQLSPEKQDKLLAQVKQRRSKASAPSDTQDAAPAPRAGFHPLDALAESAQKNFRHLAPEDMAEEEKAGFGTGHPSIDRFLANTVTSGVNALASMPAAVADWMTNGAMTPRQSAEQMQERAKGGTPAPKAPPKVTGADASDLASQTAGGLAAGALVGEAGAAGLRLAPRVLRGTGEFVTGTGPRAVKGLVEDTNAANAADAVKVAEANHAAAMKHLEETQNALHETAGRELSHAEALKAAKDEAVAKRKAQLTQHLADKAKAEAQRRAAEAKFEADRAAQRKIEPQEKKLSNARSALRAAVETAREKALKVGNEKYNTLNEKLNPIPADMEAVHALYHEAAESMGEAQAEPPLIKRLGTALDRGGEMTYKDLQPIYSDLGKELSKGTLPGTTYHAYDLMQEKIGDEMQRIADSQGQGEQLTNARGYWRRMKQTFGKPISFNDAASKALGSLKDETQENQIRLLGSFDPEIPKLFSHVSNIEKGADSLPKPVPERELRQKLVESRPALPDTKDLRNKPAVKDVAPIERVAPPDRPAEMLPAPRKIGAEDVQAAKAKSMSEAGRRVHNRVMWAAVTPTLIAIEQLVRLHGLSAGEIGAAAVGTAGMTGVASLVSRVFENPKFVEFMTKATPRDVAAIPPELRGNFPAIVKAAQSKGIRVSPALVGMAAASGLAPRKPEQNATDAWQGVEQQ